MHGCDVRIGVQFVHDPDCAGAINGRHECSCIANNKVTGGTPSRATDGQKTKMENSECYKE
jgi:hypothetical protein